MTYIALLNHHVLFELTEKLALEIGLITSLRNQACVSQNVLQGPVSRDGLVLLPANYNGEERNSKTAQVERLCP